VTSSENSKAGNGAAQSPAPERREWQTDEGRVLVELQGSRVLMMEGIPPGANVKALSRMSWQ
jgi:hypothetical protein